jgi:hypothetical protein
MSPFHYSELPPKCFPKDPTLFPKHYSYSSQNDLPKYKPTLVILFIRTLWLLSFVLVINSQILKMVQKTLSSMIPTTSSTRIPLFSYLLVSACSSYYFIRYHEAMLYRWLLKKLVIILACSFYKNQMAWI